MIDLNELKWSDCKVGDYDANRARACGFEYTTYSNMLHIVTIGLSHNLTIKVPLTDRDHGRLVSQAHHNTIVKYVETIAPRPNQSETSDRVIDLGQELTNARS